MGFFKVTTLINIFNWIIHIMNIFDLIYIYSIEKYFYSKEGVNLFLCFLKQNSRGVRFISAIYIKGGQIFYENYYGFSSIQIAILKVRFEKFCIQRLTGSSSYEIFGA